MTRFRVTDERGWEFPFDADSPESLGVGIRAGWDAYIAHTSPAGGGAAHPAIALRARETEIGAWLAERTGRVGATAEQRRSWAAQARHWRFEARSGLGGSGYCPLRLHVWGDAGGIAIWLNPSGTSAFAPRVIRAVSLAECSRLLTAGERMVAHHAVLMGVADSIAEVVRQVQFPPLRSADAPAEPPRPVSLTALTVSILDPKR